MALKLLQVLVLGAFAAAADDIPVTWSATSRIALPCVVPDAGRVQPRRPPPPIDPEDSFRPRPYFWRRGDDEINPKRVTSTGALEVTRRRDGEGVYQCGVHHHAGVVLGYPTLLKFASIGKEVSLQPEHTEARVGQAVVLTCSISSAPPAEIAWLRDEQHLPEDERYYELSNQLIITDVRIEDAGSYRCTATNTQLNKTRTSHTAGVQVTAGDGDLELGLLPLSQDGNITMPRGSRVVLACPVIGWPKPRLIWVQIPPGGRIQEVDVVDQVFVLVSLEPEQEGVYTCSVEGSGELVKTFNVTILEPPIIEIPPASKEVLPASTVRFNCTAVGIPEPKVTWYKDGQPLIMAGRINLRNSTDAKRIELVISGLTSTDAGVYQCFAQNAASVVSAWATLNVTGADVGGPLEVHCLPLGPRTVAVRWKAPATGTVLAYTLHSMLESKVASQAGLPHPNTEEIVTVDKSLTPYSFQVRAYVQLSANLNVATDMSTSVVCQGQGVPIRLAKLDDDDILVSWKNFADQNPGVMQWMLQYKPENSTQEKNVTLDGAVNNYTLNVSPNKPLQVRVLGGSKNMTWLHQNLTLVPWTSTTTAGLDPDARDVIAIPQELEVTQVSSRAFSVTWLCEESDGAEDYTFMVCAKKKVDGHDKCQARDKNYATFEGLQPNSEYEIRVQARLPGRALGGAFSAPYIVTTLPEGSLRFKGFSGQFVNTTTLKVSWNGPPARYTVNYSAHLTLPVEQWNSVETTNNTVLIPGIDPANTTFLMVTGYDPLEHSKIETIPPLFKDLELDNIHYEYSSAGIRVWWDGAGPRVVSYSQNITRAVEQWSTVEVTEPSVELTGLDPDLNTYVMVETRSGTKKHYNKVLTIMARPKDNSSVYLGVSIGCGVAILLIMAATAVCVWRKKKRAQSPVRSRRRNLSANEGNEEEGSELKNVGGRLANGGGSKDAGEPLLNGHVHITENPTSKTPNGKTKKSRQYEPAFDVSRYDDPDTTMETVLDADTSSSTAYNLLDTSRRTEFDASRSSRDVSANNSFPKLPDDNMNSEITRSADLQLDNSKIQPTLQPNG